MIVDHLVLILDSSIPLFILFGDFAVSIPIEKLMQSY